MIKRLLLFCVLFSTTAYSQYYSKYSVQLLKADTIDVHLGTRLQIAADTTVFQGIVGFGASTMSLASDSSVIFDVGVRIRGSHGLKIDGVLRAGSGIFDTALDTAYTNAVSNVTSLNTFLGVTTAGKTKRLTVDTTKYATSSVSGFLKFSDWRTFNAKQPAIGFPLRTDSGGTGLSSYTAGDLLYYASGTAFTKLGIGLSGRWLGSSGTAPQWNAPAALTKTDDTNVTLTLGGSPTTALLNAASITAGWTGQLGISRGGTGQATAVAAFDALAPTTTTGDLIYFDGADNVRRAIGSANDVLQTIGGVPAWVTNPTFGNIVTGTLTSGLINGQTISSAANFTGTGTFGGDVTVSGGEVFVTANQASVQLRLTNQTPSTGQAWSLISYQTGPLVISESVGGNVLWLNLDRLYPNTTNSVSLGLSGNRWSTVYGVNADLTGSLIVTGDVAINGGDLTSTATTFNAWDATVTAMNFARAATALTMGATTGTTTVNNNLYAKADIKADSSVTIAERSGTPTTPATGYGKMYWKTDGKLYGKNDGGTEYDLTAGGGSGISDLNGLTASTQTFADVDDTNVTLAISSVTDAHTFTLGWTGQLSVARGGTGAATLTGLLQGNGTGAITGITNSSTVGQVLRVTGASTYAWGALDLADGDAITGDLPYANLTPSANASRLLGRTSASAGDWGEVSLGASLVMNTTTLERAALTGDVTATQNSNSTTIANNAVTNAKLADVATATFKGRTTAATGDPENLTVAQAKALLGIQTAVLGADHAINSTTATEVTGLQVSITSAGTYRVIYHLIVQSTVTSAGLNFALNFTGTSSRRVIIRREVTTGTTAATGVLEDIVTTLTGNLVEGRATTAFATTAGNLGPNAGVTTASQDIMVVIECVFVCSTTGDFELWHSSEDANFTTVDLGSVVEVMKMN